MADPTERAFFPGTFDPLTLGHLDLVRRAARLFARLTVGVAHNPEKRTLFDVEERMALCREATRELAGVDVMRVDGLVVQACRSIGARVIVRGVRSGTDFDFEVAMARTNRAMSPEVDTLLLVPAPEFAHVSSTLVRQIAQMGGAFESFVPTCVAEALRKKTRQKPQDPA